MADGNPLVAVLPLGELTQAAMATTGDVEGKLGHSFADASLLSAALTHGSKKDKEADYQRLEFLGDRVLSLVIADELFHRFPHEKEGPLAARLSLLVRAETCAAVGEALQLQDHIMVGDVERRKGLAGITSVLGDVVEAVIGALYLDGGFDLSKAFILKHWQKLLVEDPLNLKDAKTFVQEWAQGQALPLPVYDVQAREGLEHAPTFIMSLQVGDLPTSLGRGGSKQLAEMDAAKAFILREGLR